MKRIFSSLLIFTMVVSMFFSSMEWKATASGEEAPRFEAVDITDTTATLEWGHIDGAVSYSLHLFGTELFGFTTDKFRHEVTGLTPNMVQEATLYYRDAADETFELKLEFTTAPLVLAAPANIRVLNVTTNSAEIHWDHNPFAIRYEVEVDGEFAGGVDQSPYSIRDLTENTTYDVKVYASYGHQYSSAAAIEFTTTGGSWPDAAEVNLRAVDVTATTATLVWNEIPAATEYRLFDGEDVEQRVTAASYELTGLSPNTAYAFSLIASHATASSSEYTHTFTTAPAPPTGLTATAGDAQVRLAWDAATGEGYTYHVKRSTTSGGSYATIAASVTAATYQDTTAVNGTTYYYVVTTVNQGLESANPNEVRARPTATIIVPTQPITGTIVPIVPITGAIVTEDNSPIPSDRNNSTVILKVDSTIEQTEDGRTISTTTVDPAELQKAIDALKSTSGTPTIIIDVPGNGEITNILLGAGMIAELQAQVPSALVSARVDSVTYDLPVKALDLPAMAEKLGAEVEEMNINITIDKVSGSSLTAIERAANQSGLQQISEAVDFHVTAESNGNTTSIDDFGNVYVSREILLSKEITSSATGVLYNPTLGTFSFVPSTFKVSADNTTIATLKRTSNSIYTVVQFSKTFEDLNGHWARADVELLASKLVVKGRSDDRFEPEHEITRAEFASLLVRAMGLSEDNTARFSDVQSTDWFAGAVNAAAKAGFVDGLEDGTFGPGVNITREQMAVMIIRAMSFAGQEPTTNAEGLSVFTDSQHISDWAKDAVAQSVSAGVIYGKTAPTFSPKENASRAEATVMLKRMLHILQFIN
ncbi:S-layer homology domain-containing protein [Paenibacillus sp. 1P07SE]|uniref:S-layer homology domain-containing protein n=1 Tax=Paenibacillus sp. 1P07SE TaxID=3132209 RepID=UPI0039A47666